jgi:acyl-CoA thioester hydrolase
MPSSIDVRVPPRFCDAQAMVHASRYHELLEDAFLHWLEDRGLPYDELRSSGVDLVIGTSTIRYRRPARLGDVLRVTADATTATTSTVTVGFTIAAAEAWGAAVAEAEVTYIAVADGSSTTLPAALR